jgi:hypothetical protein
MLLSNQKTFVQRLDSPLDDKKAWLNSIAQASFRENTGSLFMMKMKFCFMKNLKQ